MSEHSWQGPYLQVTDPGWKAAGREGYPTEDPLADLRDGSTKGRLQSKEKRETQPSQSTVPEVQGVC